MDPEEVGWLIQRIENLERKYRRLLRADARLNASDGSSATSTPLVVTAGVDVPILVTTTVQVGSLSMDLESTLMKNSLRKTYVWEINLNPLIQHGKDHGVFSTQQEFVFTASTEDPSMSIFNAKSLKLDSQRSFEFGNKEIAIKWTDITSFDADLNLFFYDSSKDLMAGNIVKDPTQFRMTFYGVLNNEAPAIDNNSHKDGFVRLFFTELD
jgi:hypothetical protein